LPRANELIAIVNSSPLIYLGKLGLLSLLQQLFEQVLTVDTVREEVLDSSTSEYAVLHSAFSDWLVVSKVPKNPLLTRLGEMGLHPGEVDALVLAYHTKEQKSDSVIVVDDLAARDVARTLGLKVTGTIGIILRATRNRLLTKNESRAKICSLVEETSFRMSASLYSRVISDLE
jgi:predicted nucleic acid-binding protein